MVNRLLYDQALRLSICSLLTLHLSSCSPVILDKLQVTGGAEADGCPLLWTPSHPPDRLLLTLQVSAQVSPLKPFPKAPAQPPLGSVFTSPSVPCYSSTKCFTQVFLICLCATLEC